MPTLEVILVFAGIPLLVIITIFLLVYAPSWVKGPRYRPGQPWEAKTEWFGPNAEAAAAGASAGSAATEGGGRSRTASNPSASRPSGEGPSSPDQTGGASAGW
jgi:hypothetical protein